MTKKKIIRSLAFFFFGLCVLSTIAWLLREAGIVHFAKPKDMTSPCFAFGLIAYGLLAISQR